MHACTVVIVRVLISIHIESFAHLMTFSSAVVCVCMYGGKNTIRIRKKICLRNINGCI